MITNNKFYSQEINGLKLIIMELLNKNTSLHEELKEIKSTKELLEKQIDFMRLFLPKFKCKHPPFVLSDILHISSKKIVKIAEIIEIIKDDDSCLRIPRVKKTSPEKFETTLLFSDYGVMQICEAIFMTVTNQKHDKRLIKLLENDLISLLNLFTKKEYTDDDKDYQFMSELSLKEIWDNEEEDKAWEHL